jgi:hypothetical protein
MLSEAQQNIQSGDVIFSTLCQELKSPQSELVLDK